MKNAEDIITDSHSSQTDTNDLSRAEVWRMFDRIANRYDLLNHLLSFGQDYVWRNRVAKHLSDKKDQIIADVATGTADLMFSICSKRKDVKLAIGIDMALKMLEIGRSKIKKKGFDDRISVAQGDAAKIPLGDKKVDAVTIGFGIRNVTDVPLVLKEMYRVLKQNGRLLILEFSLPSNLIMKPLFKFYLRYILPVLGSLISGDRKAYRYLNKTVESFPYGAEFCRLIEDAGFAKVDRYPLSFGIATIYCGEKN